MEVVYPRCAGLDVHKKLIVACVRVIESGRIVREKERFGTTTAELMRLANWMTAHQVTHAAMESTGVYWKPVWHVLEQNFQLILIFRVIVHHDRVPRPTGRVRSPSTHRRAVFRPCPLHDLHG